MDETTALPERRNSDPRRPSDSADRPRPASRAKENHVRTRVSRACDRCKARKTRCSGKWPCIFCSHLNLECRFTATYRRGQVPAIDVDSSQGVPVIGTGRPPSAKADGDADNAFAGSAPWSVSETEPATMEDEALQLPSPRQSLKALDQREDSGSLVQSMRNSPERTQTDQQGHYVGPASGVSFLLRIQRKLHQQSSGSSNSSIFTFGDLPLPGGDAAFALLPEKSHAVNMVRRYYEFAAATHRFTHRQTIEAWLEEMYETDGLMNDPETAPSRTALLFMIFALSTNYMGSNSSDTVPISRAIEKSARYFFVAEQQLSAEKGKIRLTSVQARLAQCFYLLTHSRLNHCWTLFGITAHLVMALGIHRKSRVDPKNANLDLIDHECRKRTFWCAYNLNTYLSAALGRPMTFHDEEIDQVYPACIDDSQLFQREMSMPPGGVRSLHSAPIAQHKLSRIVVQILRQIYGIRPPSTEDHFRLAAKFTAQLDDWWKDIAYLVDSDGDQGMFVKLVLRQRDVLRLACWHAKILVHRPFLLNTFASLANYSSNRHLISARKSDIEKNTQLCLDAAMKIVQLTDRIHDAGELFSTLFFIPYYAFSAVVCLYVYAIQQRFEPPETYIQYFEAASRCHYQIESIATRGSLMQRYGVVLQEMRLEVLQHNTFLASATTPESGGAIMSAELTRSHGGTQGLIDTAIEDGSISASPEIDGREMPSDLAFSDRLGQMTDTDMALFGGETDGIAQMTGWGQFDSLVTGGNGGLDGLFLDGGMDSIFSGSMDVGK